MDQSGLPDSPPEEAPPATAEELEAQADAAEDFLDGLLDILDFDADLDTSIEDDGVVIELVGEDMGLLIGRHGATLDALQDLTRAAVKNVTGAWPQVTVDIEGYLERRRENLAARARSAAERARTNNESVALPPMSSTERRIVHEALANDRGVRTGSEGQGPDRHVVIHPA